MTVVIDCPSCGRSLRVPPELAGKSVQCPACGRLLQVGPGRAPPAGPPSAAGAEPPLLVVPAEGVPVRLIEGVPPPPAPLRPVLIESWRDPQPPGRPDDERPWESPGPGPRRDCEPHRGPVLKTLGLVSLLLGMPSLCGAMCLPLAVSGLLSTALGIATWVMAQGDLRKMDDKVMELEGRASTQTGRDYAIAGMVLGGLGLICSVGVHLLPWVARLP